MLHGMAFSSDICIERIALQAIADEVSQARRSPTAAPLVGIEPSLATSLWQKAIRRGHVAWAMAAVLGLHQRDPDYVWRRLRVIALEEVSVADLALVSQVLAIAGKRQLRAKLGERAVLAYLTRRLVQSAKCRTPCDMVSWLDPVAGEAPLHGVPVGAEHVGLDDLEGIRHAAALWRDLARQSVRIAGRWVTSGQRDPARRDALLEQVDAPAALRYIVRKGHGTYALNTLSVPAHQLARLRPARHTRHEPLPESLELIGGIPAYAYCMYSAAGREALRQWLARNRWQVDGALQPKDRLGVLGHLVFYVEGGFCARRLDIASGAAIETASEHALLGRYGIDPNQVRAFKDSIPLLLPSLNQARRRVMEKH